MDSSSEYVAYYLEQLHRGDGDAFFSLIEGGSEIVTSLIKAFGQDENHDIRSDIVRCIWQHRRPEDIDFLKQLLDDPESEVWKEALDGIFAIGGDDAILAMQEFLSKAPIKETDTLEWVREALSQLKEREQKGPDNLCK